jgi:ATP-binding cassette subfamily B protein
VKSLIRIVRFAGPYKGQAAASLLLLLGMVGADLLIPRLTQRIIDDGITMGNLNVVVVTALVMLAAAGVSALFALANNFLSVRVAQSYAHDVRSALVRKVQGLSFANLDELRTGHLISRTTSDIQMTQMIVMMGLRILGRAPIWIVGAVIMLVLTSPRLALMMACFVPVIVGIIALFARRLRPMFLVVQEKLDRLNTVLQENLAGVRVVKAFVREKHEIERFEDANVALMEQNIRVMRLVAFLMPAMMIILNLAVAGALWFGGTAVLSGDMTVGQVVASITYLMFALFPLMMLVGMLAPIAAADASAGRIFEVLDAEPGVRERPDARPLEECGGRIAFEDVCFGYDAERADAVLSNVSFVAEPGQTVAILGATGSGKSTLIHLIPRFYDATSGRVTLDGTDVRDLRLSSLRRHIGTALQDTILFSGTIRDNIRYGRPEAGEEEVIAAAEAGQAHEFIRSFPDGYDTVIGQRGVTLSGGQRQRVAIARALLVKPKVLILDDSTSAVDIETEIRLQDALDELISRSADATTRFVVAQRISTVLLADKILVLDRGRIAAEGKHRDLLETSAIYRDIYRSQLGEPGSASGKGDRG